MFELFHRLWEFFEDYIEPVKPKGSITVAAWDVSKSLFDVNHLFRPVFRRWFIVTESQLLRWIDKAMELDKVNPQCSLFSLSIALISTSAFLPGPKVRGNNRHRSPLHLGD